MKLSLCFLGGPQKGRINITITAEHARQRGQQESGRAGHGLTIQEEMVKRKSEGYDRRIEQGGRGGGGGGAREQQNGGTSNNSCLFKKRHSHPVK